MPLLFATTLFLSATLLFVVQPMIAKMLLPLLGGTPAVWNVCLVFFQALLLAGYTYAHVLTTRFKPKQQAAIHASLLLLSLLTLPIAIPDDAVQSLPAATNPAFWLLRCLLGLVALPFFVISATAPLLQKWFSQTSHPSAHDPYFLYAASNLGSLIALVGYPVLLEPALRLREQSWGWAAGFVLFGILICCCFGAQVFARFRNWSRNAPSLPRDAAHELQAKPVGRSVLAEPSEEQSPNRLAARRDGLALPSKVQDLKAALASRETDQMTGASDSAEIPQEPISNESSLPPAANELPLRAGQRLLWIALAFVPSSLMMAVTTYLTTDIASIPLLWILPLGLYLLSFVVVFARRRILSPCWLARVLPIGAVGLTYLLLSEATQPTWLILVLHLVFFFAAALVCHGRLADTRPAAAHLTEFYLWLSVGGVLGGLFNALVAPAIFTRVAEYPIGIVLACLLGRDPRIRIAAAGGASASRTESPWPRRLDFVVPAAIGLVTVAAVQWIPTLFDLPIQLRLASVFGLPAVLTYLTSERPVRFGWSLGALLLAGSLYAGGHGPTLHAERNFFGVLRVTLDPGGAFRRLIHGNTVHGRQFINPARQCEPLSYYHRTGPLGQIFAGFDMKSKHSNVAVVGLGAGAMACYSQSGQLWTYYEINPAVIRLAGNTNYFSFLPNCSTAAVRLVVGDARLRLREAPPRSYDLIILDAFSSDAIPVHLLTAEAIDLYLSKLADGGMLAFHISNRCLDLEPVLGALAARARLVCHSQDENDPSALEEAEGKDPSHWVVMARRREDLGRLARDGRWIPVLAPKMPAWTDDFSNILSVFRWD